MKETPAMTVSGSLSALMQRHSKRAEAPPASNRPIFNLPELPAFESGDPTVSVHCFLTTSIHPGFSYNSRAVFKSVSDAPTGSLLKTKFSFTSVTADRIPLISRNLDRELVSFLSGVPFVFVRISRERLSLSEIARFILETNAHSEGFEQREFEVRVPGEPPFPLRVDESFDREFTQIQVKTRKSGLYVLNLYADVSIRQFSEVLNQFRVKVPLSSENSSFRALFPLFEKKIHITVFLYSAIGDEFLICAFAEKKKSVVEQPRPPRDFQVDPEGVVAEKAVDTTDLLMDRATAQLEAMKKYVQEQMAGLRRAVAGSEVLRLLADLAESERANNKAREQIIAMEAEIVALENELTALRERGLRRAELAHVQATIRNVIARTEELRGRYQDTIKEMRIAKPEEEDRPPTTSEDTSAVAGIDAAQHKAREDRRRRGRENQSDQDSAWRKRRLMD
jgi:hypothetical protein